MEIFVRVAECGSFSRAATYLGISNATATTSVRALERHLNVVLLNRNTHSVSLTEEGKHYLPKARELLLQLDREEDSVRSLAGALTGSLRVEVPSSLGNSLICPMMPAFAQRYPGISTYISLNTQPHHLVERGIDIAIRLGHVEDMDLVARPLYKSSYVICCTREFAARIPAHPRDLDPASCIGVHRQEHNYSNSWAFRRGNEALELRPAGPLHFNTSDAVLMAATSGMGVACVLDVFVHRHLQSGSLVQVYGDWTTPSRSIYAVIPKSRTRSAKVRAFTAFLVELFAAQRRTEPREMVPVKKIKKK